MAFKLFAAEKAQKEALVKELTDQEEEMKKQFELSNRQIAKAVADFQDTVDDYEALREKAEKFREEIAERCRTEIDDKTEKWLESDAGQAAEEFTSQWENIERLDQEMEGVETIELQYELVELSEPFSNLPDGAE